VSQTTVTNYEQQLRSQPEQLQHLLTDPATREQVHVAAEGLHRVRRIWVVGTGSSQHVAALSAAMLQDAGRSAHSVSSMQFVRNAPIVGGNDGVIVITHSGTTAYAIAARALAFSAGLQTVTITKRGVAMNDVVETVEKETSETGTISFTAGALAVAMIAAEMGADAINADAVARVPGSVGDAIDASGVDRVPLPARSLAVIGAGPAAITAAEGALKVREAARMIATGYDAEYFLHGSAVPLTPEDHLVALTTPDEDGFVEAVARTAEAAGIGVSRIGELAPLPVLLAQIPLAVRLQLLALRYARERGTDPDTIVTGEWNDPALWRIGFAES
jgi:glucosamine--fructose-6-phosphate aminotransferase (isomerizing)